MIHIPYLLFMTPADGGENVLNHVGGSRGEVRAAGRGRSTTLPHAYPSNGGDTETSPLLDKETIITIDYVGVRFVVPI